MGIGIVFKKVLALSLTLFFLFSALTSLSPRTHAVNGEKNAEIYSKASIGRIFSAGRKVIARLSPTSVEVSSDTFKVDSELIENSVGVKLTPSDGNASFPVSLTAVKDNAIDITQYSELFFRLGFSGDISKTLSFKVILRTDSGESSINGKIKGGEDYDVFVPLSAFIGLESVREIEVVFSSDSHVSEISISSIYADGYYSYEHIERFSAERFSSDIGIEVSETELLPVVSEGNAEYHSPIALSESEQSNTMTALVTISGAKNGTMTLSIKNTFKNEMYDVATVTLFSGRNSYPFVFDSSKGIDLYRLSFSNITEEDGEKLTVHSVGFGCFGEKLISKSDKEGSILTCTLSSDSSEIQISGTLRSSTVADNMDLSIGIVAEDIWQSDITEVLAIGDITTVFNFSVPTGKLKLNPSFYRYYLVLIEDADNTRKLSNGIYPAIASPNVKSGKSAFGLQSNDTAAAFISNASHTVIDVYLDKLESKDGTGGRLHSYGDGYRYISNSYVSEIDEKIAFSIKSDIPTYIRILEKVNPDTGSDISYAYSFNASDYSLAMRYMTLIDFISSRYKGISGYIVGTRADSRDCNFCNTNSLISYAENYALILRLTSTAVRANTADAFISVSIGDGYSYNHLRTVERDLSYSEFSGIGEYTYSPHLFSSVLSHAISDAGSFNWFMTYECENSPENGSDTAYRIYSSLLQGSGTTPSGHMLFWQPEKNVSASEVCKSADTVFEKCTQYGTRAAILSLTKQSGKSSEIAEAVSSLDIGGNDRVLVKGSCSVNFEKSSADSTYYVWNFINSYSVEGFISAGNISSLTTEFFSTENDDGTPLGKRSLHGKLKNENGERGIILSYFESPIKLGELDSIKISLYTNSEKCDYVRVTSVLGTGNRHYEYEASVPTGKTVGLNLYSDIIPSEETINYIALSFETDDEAEFDILSISASSSGKGADEISSIIGAASAKESNKTHTSDIALIIGSAIVVTAVIFTALSIKQETGRKDKQKQ